MIQVPNTVLYVWISKDQNHCRRSCTKLSARKTPKLLEVKYIQKPVADLQEIHPSSDPTAAERRQHNQEEQPAARKQVFSPTLEIRSYQQVDRILISSVGGCWLIQKIETPNCKTRQQTVQIIGMLKKNVHSKNAHAEKPRDITANALT